MLSDSQIERYSRQIILPQVGGKGQTRLLQAKILVSGDSPLQVHTLLYLAAAGVGQIGIQGRGDDSLLQALTPGGQGTTVSALQRLNSDCTFVVHNGNTLSEYGQFVQLVRHYDLVISEPMTQLHTASYATRRPFVCGQASTTSAWLAVYRGYEDRLPCFVCEPPSFAEESAADGDESAAFIGTLLATEAIKLVLGLTVSGPTKMFHYRFPELSFHDRILVKNPHCSLCQQ